MIDPIELRMARRILAAHVEELCAVMRRFAELRTSDEPAKRSAALDCQGEAQTAHDLVAQAVVNLADVEAFVATSAAPVNPTQP